MNRHAYINIEPNNGGIVLNVSDGGLCFHSFDPVQRNGTIRFWFSDHNQRIEADGTLVWSDETQKGGLRFTAVPAEAREKLREWIGHPAMPSLSDSMVARPQPASVPSTGPQRETKIVAGYSAPLAVVSPESEMPRPVNGVSGVSGFSRGLATGLLVSALVVAVFSFNNYRREVGESLIRLGEQFAAKPRAQTLTVSAASPEVLPTAQPLSSDPRTLSTAPGITPTTRTVPPASPIVSAAPAPSQVARLEKVLPPPEKVPPQPSADPDKSQPAKLESAKLSTTTPTAVGDAAPKVPATVAAPAISSAAPMISLPSMAPIPPPAAEPATAGAGGSSVSGKLPTAARIEPANQPGVHTEGSGAENADSARELYFEVGKFKNVSQAHDESDKLAQLGFPVTAVQKGFLWTNSFHVLVGPYPDEEKAKVTQDSLRSDGFRPRPFEKGWRNFTLISSVTLNGARTPEGDYTITWESYIGDASVKFVRNDSVIATADGRWVKHDVKYPRDAYVYRRNPDGSRTLLELHFGGMRQALVFGKGS
jgi:hypothetical protein